MRKLVQRCFRRLGLDIYHTRIRFVDAFADQRKLFQGRASVIFDVGANVGNTVAAYRKDFPSAIVYAFEPTDPAFAALSKRFINDRNVKPQRLALGDREGTQTFFLYSNDVNNGLLQATKHAAYVIGNPFVIQARGTTEVQVTTLDRFCDQNEIAQIDVLKIDVQGAELLVLQGAVGMLDKGAIRMIHTEVQFAEQYENQTGYLELFDFLRKRGFELFGMYDMVRGGGGYAVAANATFLPRRKTLPSA